MTEYVTSSRVSNSGATTQKSPVGFFTPVPVTLMRQTLARSSAINDTAFSTSSKASSVGAGSCAGFGSGGKGVPFPAMHPAASNKHPHSAHNTVCLKTNILFFRPLLMTLFISGRPPRLLISFYHIFRKRVNVFFS